MLETTDRDEMIKWIGSADFLNLQYYIETITVPDPRPARQDRMVRGWRCVLIDMKEPTTST